MKKLFTSQDKAKVALEALRGIKSMSEIASASGAHPIQIGLWKKQALAKLHVLFGDERNNHEAAKDRLIEDLYKALGKRDIELDFLKKNIERMGP